MVLDEPSDSSQRQRFAGELDRNFSVVASAGSGKTRAVTDRIAALAQAPGAVEMLPRLIVLTFTNRAADEMQQRAREEILRAQPTPEILAAFNRAWFGTIHAFCLKLLNDYGHYLGLPAPLELVTDDEDLWTEFVQQQTHIGRTLRPEDRAALLRLTSIRHIMELGRRAGSGLLRPNESGPCPPVDLRGVLSIARAAKKSDAINHSIAQLEAWEEDYRCGSGFLRWPVRRSTTKAIVESWNAAFIPLRRWVNQTAICVAAEVQRDYRNFRLERGVVTYADQIALADELLQHPEAALRLRELDHIVILDEAQDTDPAQFSVLLELTRPPEASGRWLETKTDPPRPGLFSMVGDFQQSIYGDRADLRFYRRVHETLVETGAGEALEFSVTFRLDQAQLDFVNAAFRDVLHGSDGQVSFVELEPRPTVLPGQVIQLKLSAKLFGDEEKPKERRIAQLEADELARWLKKNGLAKLRARSWREVAILCPRRDWLRTMAGALRRENLPLEVQSESDLQADSPAYAWLTALCTIMAEPRNGYEIVGVLREIYGQSDHDLAIFAEGDGARFQIEEPVTAVGVIHSTLGELTALRAAVIDLPLYAAIEQIIDRTALRARIAALPEEDFKEPLADLESLLTLAAESAAHGATLADFAERLRSEMERQRPVRLSERDAIQLITAQKAKGSEWDAVILPFLSRRIVDPPPRYPSLIKIPGTDEIFAALHKEDYEDEARKYSKTLRRHEMKRLLYVALTRARHTLVLALDQELFSNSEGKINDNTQLKFLHGPDESGKVTLLEALACNPAACVKTAAAWTEKNSRQTAAPAPVPPLTADALRRARARAHNFIRKQNPSAFDPPEDPGLTNHRPRSLADNPATLYGSWWHGLFQHFPWKCGAAQQEAAFASVLSDSPQAERSAREWKLLQAALRDSALAKFLQRPSLLVHTEYPFLWRMNDRSCLEGVIDLLLIDLAARRCLLLDWKTNAARKGDEEKLRLRYCPQIAAYWRALTQITGCAVEAALFSTSLGKLLPYDPAALATEWTRLEALPPEGLAEAVAPDEAF